MNSKYVLIKSKGGLGNRLLCAVTGILYAEITGRTPIVDWTDGAYSDKGVNAFPVFFKCDKVSPLENLPVSNSVFPSIWENNLSASLSELMHEYDPTKHRSKFIHQKYSLDVRKTGYDQDIVVFWNYMDRLRNLRRHFTSQSRYAGLDRSGILRKFLKEEIQINPGIINRVKDYKDKHWADNVIGVHIRYTDRKTRLAKYDRPISRLLDANPDSVIFLATDHPAVNEKYHEKYDRVISTEKWFPEGTDSMHQNTSCPDKVENGMEALVDMLLLSECNSLVYPGYSTFSWISSLLSDAPAENIVDVEKYNLKVRAKEIIRELIP